MSKTSDFLGDMQRRQAEFMKKHPDLFKPAKFEDPIKQQTELYESLLSDELPLCEAGNEDHEATCEWVYRDEEGAFYSTFRCDDHPVKDPEYEMRDL